MIDLNRTYRTRAGQAVRLYASDGGGCRPVHGAIAYDNYGWSIEEWYSNGYRIAPGFEHAHDLIEVTLADELRDQIPWSPLRQKVRYVAFDPICGWWGFYAEPKIREAGNGWILSAPFDLACIAMPEVDPARWRETLVERPYSDEDYELAP